MSDLLQDLWLRLRSVEKRRAADVKSGTIVRWQGEWGVKEGKLLERWIGGPLRLPRDAIVEVLPGADVKRLTSEDKSL